MNWWHKKTLIVASVMLVSLIFGILDGWKASGFSDLLPSWIQSLPLSKEGLAWLPPSIVVFLITAIHDRVFYKEKKILLS